MANAIKLSANVPVVAPGETLTFTAKVTDSSTHAPAEGVKVDWSIDKNSTATLGAASSTTSASGYATNSVTNDTKLALTITGTLDDDNKISDSVNVGFYSTDLTAPIIPQAKDGVLDEKAVSGLVQAMIKRHTDDPEIGDLYTFYWGGTFSPRFDDGTSDTFPWVINVKNEFTVGDVLADGNYTVYYTVEDLAGNLTYSVPQAITVTGGSYVNPVYDAPQFPDVIQNTINYDLVTEGDGVKVHIPYPQISENAEIFPGNTITLYMIVFDKNYKTEIIPAIVVASYDVAEGDPDADTIVFTLPKEAITDSKETFDDVRGRFWYTVTGSGSVAVAGSSFAKNLIIDTVPPHFAER